eukprot:Lithocolla_globosa_v1_NODE_2209_length_2108_cov_67.504627.p1 type:complete len:507 gc:universal NODE_2209_length_2108_cov_67.504627:1539-19(-)
MQESLIQRHVTFNQRFLECSLSKMSVNQQSQSQQFASSYTTYVHFFCQKCKSPLKIDSSLLDLTAQGFEQITGPLGSETIDNSAEEEFLVQSLVNQENDGVSRKVILDRWKFEPTSSQNKKEEKEGQQSEEYVLVGEGTGRSGSETSVTTTTEPTMQKSNSGTFAPSEQLNARLKHRWKVASRLFDVVSRTSSIDHPLCAECNEELQNELDNHVIEAEKQREFYTEFLRTNPFLENKDQTEADFERELEQLSKEDQQLRDELEKLELEQLEIQTISCQLDEEHLQLEKEEQQFLQEYNLYQSQLDFFLERRDHLLTKYEHATEQLEKLRKTNVLNDVFRIWFEGPFGTISNFRLGRVPSTPVEWNEINAAWGQAVLLLNTLAKSVHNFKFSTYKLINLGSFSRIERITPENNKASYELYGSGEFGRLFSNRRFDTAMVAFLDCINQLAKHAEKLDPNFKLPYRIDGDKIGELTIKYTFNQDVMWTKALKYMLTNLKWCLLWVCKQQ